MEKIIGRTEETLLLADAMKSTKAGLIAVYGRRRVGKTFLIHTYFNDRMAFELTGMYSASLKEQLQQFSMALQKRKKYQKKKGGLFQLTNAAITPDLGKNGYHHSLSHRQPPPPGTSTLIKNGLTICSKQRLLFLMN